MSAEPDILEALTELAEAEIGGPMPKCLSEHTKFVRTGEFLTNPETGTSVGLATNDWGTALSEIARRAKEEIVGLRLALETGAERIEALCDTLEVSLDPAGVLKEDGT